MMYSCSALVVATALLLQTSVSFRLSHTAGRTQSQYLSLSSQSRQDDNNNDTPPSSQQVPTSPYTSSRSFLPTNALLPLLSVPLAALLIRPSAAQAAIANKPAVRPFVYGVEWTDPPCLIPRTRAGEEGVLQKFAASDVLLIGEHPTSTIDHEFQATLISRIISKKKANNMAVGLEAVESLPAKQAALDAYVASGRATTPPTSTTSSSATTATEAATATDVSEEAADATLFAEVAKGLKSGVEAAAALEYYKPILHLCRKQNVRIIGLGIPANVLNRVKEGGLDGLTDEDKVRYIVDPVGFVKSVSPTVSPGFKKYTDAVIVQDVYRKLAIKATQAEGVAAAAAPASAPPLPAAAVQAGALLASKAIGELPSLENFYAARIFADEGMATSAARFLSEARETSAARGSDKSPLLVVLANENRVKFGYGLQERTERCLRAVKFIKDGEAQADTTPATPSASDASKEEKEKEKEKSLSDGCMVYSCLLNPTSLDSLSQTAQLRLTLSYGPALADSKPLADFVWFGPAYPPLRVLVRTKNAISREGEKPAGESSIIGAFSSRGNVKKEDAIDR